MMKRYSNLWDKIIDKENIRKAHQMAKKDKSFYKEVQYVDEHLEECVAEIYNMLKNRTYIIKPSDYTKFTKWDKTKYRDIYKLDYFPHRIIQHMILLQIKEIFMKSFISQTYASLPKRGIHAGLNILNEYLKNERNTKYCLKIDVYHFYPSVNREILKVLLRKKFKDKSLLWLMDIIIESLEGEKGLAIGSLFSQYASNFYLSYFDHWVKEDKKVKYYIRYMDDMVFLSSSKEEIHKLLSEIKIYLKNNLDLELKGNYQIFPIDIRGIDFLGYRIFRNYMLLRKSTCNNFKRKMIKISKKLSKGYLLNYSDNCTIQSYLGWLKWCDSYRLKQKYIGMIIRQIGDDNEILKKFSEFAKETIGITGDKVKIDDILDKEIQITGYKISDSKFKKNEDDKLLTLQFKINNEEKILFTGSKVLLEQCEKYKDEIPFETIIKKSNKFYTFS